MSIHLFVSDLDGTLLHRPDHTITPQDLSALREASAAGIGICLASGRLNPDIEATAAKLGVPCHTISQNGTAVYRLERGRVHGAQFDLRLAQEVYAFPASGSFARSVSCSDEAVYTPTEHVDLGPVEKRVTSPFVRRENLMESFGDQLAPTKFCYYGKLEELQRFQREIQSAFGDRIDALLTDVDCLDVMPAGVSKGAGLQVLMEHLRLSADEVACIGDQFNDVSMFGVTPHSFAMSHGPAAVQGKASHVVDSVAKAVRWVIAHNAHHAHDAGNPLAVRKTSSSRD
jgi:Cof subfamily protein (haloacid dehalogenase superfamily)